MPLSQWLWLVALSLLWGGAFFFVGAAVDHVPPVTLVLARVGLAALVLLPITMASGHRLPRTLREWVPFAGMSLFNNVFPFTAMVAGMTLIPSGLASVLNATTPVWSVLLLHLLTDDKLDGKKLSGVLLGVAGVAVLIGPEALSGARTQVLGMGLVVLGAMSYGCAAVWGRRLRGVSPLVSSTAQLTVSALLLFPVAMAVEQPWTYPHPPVHAIAAVVGLAVLGTTIAYLIFFHILSVSGTANAMLVTLLIPVSAIALGITFLGETLLTRHIAGALVIACGLVAIDGRLFAAISGRHRHRHSHRQPRPPGST